MSSDKIVQDALLFATAAHAACKQIRKYTGEPYIVHPIEVVDIIERYVKHTPEMLAAAYLHDVLEDTGVEYGTLREVFGVEVADMVLWLTDVSKPEDGNRSTRKEMDRMRIALAPADVQTIKVADLISNTRSIVAHDINFARVYLHEKDLLLKALDRADPILKEVALKQTEAARVILKHAARPEKS